MEKSIDASVSSTIDSAPESLLLHLDDRYKLRDNVERIRLQNYLLKRELSLRQIVRQRNLCRMQSIIKRRYENLSGRIIMLCIICAETNIKIVGAVLSGRDKLVTNVSYGCSVQSAECE
jgi:hypothetical protein